MSKLVIIMIGFFAFGLVLVSMPGEAEMHAMTDDQMKDHFFRGRGSSLTADVEKESDIVTEEHNLLGETEESKLDNYIRERSGPGIEESSGPELNSVNKRPRHESRGCGTGSREGGGCPYR